MLLLEEDGRVWWKEDLMWWRKGRVWNLRRVWLKMAKKMRGVDEEGVDTIL